MHWTCNMNRQHFAKLPDPPFKRYDSSPVRGSFRCYGPHIFKILNGLKFIEYYQIQRRRKTQNVSVYDV
jgi:hypothetical protein